jgi:hypothetical protein
MAEMFHSLFDYGGSDEETAPMKILPCLVLAAALSPALQAQTLDDGIMITRHNLFIGNLYTHDSWDHYWENHLNRSNGNLGTVTTQTNTWYADYGITDRLDAIMSVPYVWTEASQGVLHGMQGFQDITLGAKYNFLDRPFTERGSLRAFAVVYGAFPLTNYEPDFQPLSIGNQSKRISGRFTLNFQAKRGWYVNGSSAFTFRDDVTIDAPYYYTNGQLYLTDDVTMPNVFDYIVSGGYLRRGLMLEGSFSQQRTQGGGDIRRQDVPFISNHINFSRVGARFMYPIPKLRDLSVQFNFAYTPDGRNVGQSTTYTVGLMYTVHLPGSRKTP